MVKAGVPKEQRQIDGDGDDGGEKQKQKKESEGAGSERSDRSDAENVIEQSLSTNTPNDPNDLSDLDLSNKELQIHAILHTLVKDQETFTEQDWMFKASMWPNLGWKISQAEEAFKLLLQQGKIQEVEPGRYRPVVDNGKGGGGVS